MAAARSHAAAAKCKHKTHVSYGPRLPPHIAACSHDAAAIFAPAHCSSLPTRCRAPNMATNLGPICARRSNMGSWPQLHQNTTETASLRRHTHITAPLSNAMHCARAPCTSRASYARLLGWGGSTAPPSPAVKLSRTFCMNASNVAPLKTNCCWKAFAPSICWRFPANFGKNTHSLTKHKTHSPS